MKNITKFALLALLIISTNTITAQNNQENDSIISVELNEVVVSTPFKESVKNNVLNVGKLNLKQFKLHKKAKLLKCNPRNSRSIYNFYRSWYFKTCDKRIVIKSRYCF
jgi:hypothetical protein